MKKTLLLVGLLTSAFGFKASAQATEPYSLQVYDDAVYYGMYEGTVDEPLPEGAQRNNNTSYGKKITEEQIALMGNVLTLTVHAEALCDDYDRIGNVNLAFVPKGATSYSYSEVDRIEIARFITPFMNNLTQTPTQVPYVFEINNVAAILHDPVLSAQYDFWMELEIYGYQGSSTQGGAAYDFPSICANRNDVYKGSLTLDSEYDEALPTGELVFEKLSFKYEMKDYTLDGTDVLDETVKTINFDLANGVTNGYFYVVMSNHGSNAGGEEYKNRWHYVYLDEVQVASFKPGKNCEQYRQYNTMPNGVYGQSVQGNSYWLTRAWCPGGKIDTREISLGDLTAGTHSYKMDVPQATFAGDQGYFPMSVYFQGYSATAGVDNVTKSSFTVFPNPATDVVNLKSNGEPVKTFEVINTLGQTVLTGNGETINMSQLQTGMYMVKAQFANGQVATQKVIRK